MIEKDTILVVYDRLSKITHFVAAIKETLAERLVRLFRDNVWKLHRLLKSVISDRRPQFVAELTKELNGMLEIETILLIAFHPSILPTDRLADRIDELRVGTVLEILYRV